MHFKADVAVKELHGIDKYHRSPKMTLFELIGHPHFLNLRIFIEKYSILIA